MNKIQEIKFNKQEIKFHYQSEADLSVIDEFFVDKMYRTTESLVSQTTNPILDIGAHIGCFSVFARKLNSHSPIIALEPEPNNFKLLKENLKLNHCENIITKQMALVGCHPEFISGSQKMLKQVQHDNSIILYLNEDSHNHSTFYETAESIIVPAITLEDLIIKNKLKKIGILKIDIEGEEFSVIKNIKPKTWSIIENIILEYHDFRGNDHNDLENIIRSHGFSVEHFPNHYDRRFGLLVCRNKTVRSS